MSEWEIGKLAGEVRHVATVKLGFPLRKNARSDQLLALAKDLASDPELPPVRLYEEAIRPSISRLGDGALGTLAQISFGLTDESGRVRYWYQRQKLAEEELGFSGHLIRAMEKSMCEAIAADLVARWRALQPPEWEEQPPPKWLVEGKRPPFVLESQGADEEAYTIRRALDRPIPTPEPFGANFAKELEALAREIEGGTRSQDAGHTARR